MLKRATLALLFSSILSVAALAEGQRVILVLDASGSMWGQINGKAKMDIAKDVVGKVVSTWKPEDDLGLVVYGHREKGSCEDIETVWPPKPLSPSEYMSPIKSLSPKGKTPMTQAVRQAAEALKYTEQQSTVILVSDGLESCGADPCAMAKELEAAGVNLTVHTVGFGLDDQNAVAQLKCMAEETGGISVLASNAEELESALKQTVEAKVEPAPPAPEPEPTPPPPADTRDFEGHAYMAEGVELPPPFNQVVWVFSTSLDGKEGEYLSTEYGSDSKYDLTKGGELMATVTSDLAKVLVPFTHEDGKPTKLDVNMNAGIMQFEGMLDESTDLPKDGPVWTFSKADGTYYGTSYGGAPKNLFNAGDYKLKLEYGSANIEANFTVEPGKVTDMVVTLGAGLVDVSVTYDGNQAVSEGTTIELRKPANISGEKERVATEFGSNKQFKAAAGDYVVVTLLNIAKAETPLTIQSGKTVNLKVNMNAGFLAVKAPRATRIDIESGTLALDGTRERLGTEFATELNYAANAGNYHVKVYGADDAIIAEKDVTVEVGKRLEVSLP